MVDRKLCLLTPILPATTRLSERACLIAEQILYPSELLRQCARSDNRVGYLIVSHDLLRVDGLAHIQVDTQTLDRLR